MRRNAGTITRAVSLGWILPLALLALPGCARILGFEEPELLNFDPGPGPWSSLVFCDIEKPLGRHCATEDDKAVGIRLSAAAVALVEGKKAAVGLDDSPEALARCGNEPEAVLFQGPFPDGLPVCLNCSQIGLPPAPFADAQTVCAVKCDDIFAAPNPPESPLDPQVAQFCAARSHTSANFLPVGSACLDDACSDAGAELDTFIDPRRFSETVTWQNQIGVTPTGADLTRTAVTGGGFNAGAAGREVIEHGDAFVEFTAAELTDARICGFSNGPPPDTTPTLQNVDFGLELAEDGRFYVFEHGVKKPGADLKQSFGRYMPFETFRVHVEDKGNGTGEVSYAFLTSSCITGTPCSESVFRKSPTPAHYPIRIDTSFREEGASLRAVHVVRIR